MWFNELKDKARQLPVLKKVSFRQYVEDAFSYVFSILLCKVSLDEYKFLLEVILYIILIALFSHSYEKFLNKFISMYYVGIVLKFYIKCPTFINFS